MDMLKGVAARLRTSVASAHRGCLNVGPRALLYLNVVSFIITACCFIYVLSAVQAIGLCSGLSMIALSLSVTGVGAHAVFTAASVFGEIQPVKTDASLSRSRKNSWSGSGTSTPPKLSGVRTPPPRKLAGSRSKPASSRMVLLTPGPSLYVPLLGPNEEGPHPELEGGVALLAVTGQPGGTAAQAESPHVTGISGGELLSKLNAVTRHQHVKNCLSIVRICFIGVAVLSVFSIWAVAALQLWISAAAVRPDLGELSLPGLVGPVSVSYTKEGVAHIVAGEGGVEADLWMAQGAVHARDRLWQIEFQRRVATGTLSELVGAGGLETDKLFRVLGAYAAAERDVRALQAVSSHAYVALAAYCGGINAYVQAGTSLDTAFARSSDAGDWVQSYSSGYVPLEMRLLGIKSWQAYTPAHALAWAKVTAWGLAGNLETELSRYDLLVNRKQSPARINDLIPPFNTTRFPTVLSNEDFGTGEGAGDGAQRPAELLSTRVEVEIRALHSKSPHLRTPTGSGGSNLNLLDALLAAERAVEGQLQARGAGIGRDRASFAAMAAGGPMHVRAIAMLADAAMSLFYDTSHFPLPEYARDGAQAMHRLSPRRGVRGIPRPGASNNWVVHGNHTTSGLPLLANDPHLQLLAPSLWYLNRLQSDAAGINVVGASFIGSPGVVIGRNSRIGWSVTNTGVDVQDSYILDTSNDTSGSTYAWGGLTLPFAVRSESINVQGGPTVVLPVRVSRYGPVITDFGVYGPYGDSSSHSTLALRWVQTDPNVTDTLMEAVYGLQRAGNWSTFRAALRLWTGPSQNFMYADVDGHIGYQMPGTIPMRNLTGGHTGAYPVPGTGPEYDWQGFHDFDSLPHTFDPPEGYLVSANNQVPPPSFPIFLTADWDETDGYRASRIRALLSAAFNASAGKVGVQNMIDIQADVMSGMARDILARDPPGPAARIRPEEFSTLAGAALRDRLVSWASDSDSAAAGPVLSVGSTEATLWAGLLTQLAGLGTASTGTDYWLNAEYILNALSTTSDEPDPACRSVGLTCSGALARMFDAVAQEQGLQVDGSRNGETNGWGTSPALHGVLMSHEILHGTLFGCFADRSAQHGGDFYTPNVGGWALGDKTYTQTHGPSYRHIVDLSDRSAPGWGPTTQRGNGTDSLGESSLFVQPMGQRGDPLGPMYDSMLHAWENHGYVSMSARAPTADELDEFLRLNPQS